MNIGVVILHYKTYKDTIKCTESFIENFADVNYKIVIVDNFSNDGSLEILSSYFQNDDNVSIISSEYNMGFAKGNNLGNYFLKKMSVDFDFVICCNNDTYIDDSDFSKRIINSYKKYNWDVMGPDIIRVSDGVHQNPLATPNWNNYSINQKIIEFSIKIVLLKMAPFILKYKNTKKTTFFEKEHKCESKENACLHGAVLIFSKNYLKNFDDLFYDKTFLYLEEDILYFRCKRNNLKMTYDGSIKIFHNHSSSTKEVYKDEARRKIFFLKNQIASFKILKDYLKNTNR